MLEKKASLSHSCELKEPYLKRKKRKKPGGEPNKVNVWGKPPGKKPSRE
jgi:hypothetical protein